MFPHHECETAESEAVTKKPFVRLWFHAGLVRLGGTKMSKSLGNLVFVGEMCKEWEPAVLRLALLGHHYRQDWDWVTMEDMPHAAEAGAVGAPPARVRRGPGWPMCGRRWTTTWTPLVPLKSWTGRRRPAGPCRPGQRCSAWSSDPRASCTLVEHTTRRISFPGDQERLHNGRRHFGTASRRFAAGARRGDDGGRFRATRSVPAWPRRRWWPPWTATRWI